MIELIKKIELRDDGFLEIQLKRLRDFDDYLFQQLQGDGSCLPCARDPKAKGKLYYDTKGYLSMRSYMQTHLFEKQEFQDFLIFVLEDMVRVNAAKPLWMDLSYIYLHHDGAQVRFLCVPLSMDNWLFQKEGLHQMLDAILTEVRSHEAYETIGYLMQASKQKEITLPSILQGLHELKEQQRPRLTFIERLFHLEKVEEYHVRDLPQPITYPKSLDAPQVCEVSKAYQIREDTSLSIEQKTTALFCDTSSCGFTHVNSGQRFPVIKDVITIGRAPDNDLCIVEASISSYHACFHTERKELEDLHSSNGTYVNDKRMHKVLLKDGDRISFAKECYMFYLTDSI